MSDYNDYGNGPLDSFRQAWNKQVKHLRIWGIVLGIVSIFAGIVFVLNPVESAFVLSLFASILLIIFGIGEICEYAATPSAFRTGVSLVAGILNIILGILLLAASPATMLATFGILFAVILLMTGIDQLTIGSRLRATGIADTGWLTFNAVLSIIAGVIFLFIPIAGMAFTSIFIGFYLLVGGIMLLIAGIKARKLQS